MVGSFFHACFYVITKVNGFIIVSSATYMGNHLEECFKEVWLCAKQENFFTIKLSHKSSRYNVLKIYIATLF